MPAFVPSDLTGLWRRQLITAPGVHDSTTRVVWLQTRSWYVDLRVPTDRPAAGGRKDFNDVSNDELLALARIEGFAGELAVADGICSWRRDLDHQPPAPTPDEGRFTLEGEVMIEDGVHLPYREVWRREANSQSPLLAFRRDADDGRDGLLVIGGDHLLEFVARPGPPLVAGANLGQLLTQELTAGRREAAAALLATRIRYARRVDGDWRVELSSLPWLEGGAMWTCARFDATSTVLEVDDGACWRLLDASSEPTAALQL